MHHRTAVAVVLRIVAAQLVFAVAVAVVVVGRTFLTDFMCVQICPGDCVRHELPSQPTTPHGTVCVYVYVFAS